MHVTIQEESCSHSICNRRQDNSFERNPTARAPIAHGECRLTTIIVQFIHGLAQIIGCFTFAGQVCSLGYISVKISYFLFQYRP